MAKQKHADPKLDVIEMRTALARRIAARAPSPGEHATAVCGLSLFRRTTPTACYRGAYEPSLNVFVQGRKLINLGGTEYLCDGSSFLLSSIDVPVQSQIVEASEEVPLLSMLLRLDMPIVREVLSRQDLPEPEASSQRRGIAVGETTAGLLGACARLIEILETPEDVPFLSPLIQREIVYRILRTPQGERLRAIATGDLSHRTARAITWLRANYTKPLHMEELAAVERMGVSTLHHQFRALTAMSPLQYQKQLRLQSARQRMLMDGIDATSAAYEVGYESVSQFSREYRRFFGQPPMRDVKTLRDGQSCCDRRRVANWSPPRVAKIGVRQSECRRALARQSPYAGHGARRVGAGRRRVYEYRRARLVRHALALLPRTNGSEAAGARRDRQTPTRRQREAPAGAERREQATTVSQAAVVQ